MSDWTDIGEQLRQARESRGLDLRDVAHSTRIPLSTLAALEESDYSIFPSPAYARSFLSQYSDYLDVDAHDWIEAFETGDVLSNVNDHGYLKNHDEHVGEARAQRETNSRQSRNTRPMRQTAQADTSPSNRGRSILQTLSVFLMTALLIGGGIYAYKHFEPQLMGAIQEDEQSENDIASTPAEATTSSTGNNSSDGASKTTTQSPTPEPSDKQDKTPPNTPPLVVQHDPEETTDPPASANTTNAPNTNKRRSGTPPKALIVEEDDE